MSNLTPMQILEALQYALNHIPNKHLPGCPHGIRDTYALAEELGELVRTTKAIVALSRRYREANPNPSLYGSSEFIEQVGDARDVIGKNTKTIRKGDQVPGMPGAICHACGLGRPCNDPDCPNAPTTCDE